MEIYSVLEQYSLICSNREEFLQELFSIPSKNSSKSSSIISCFFFHSRRSTTPPESLSIITYTTRLLIYLLQSSLVTCSLLINQILTFFLLYAPIKRFALYLVHQTDFYTSTMIPFFSTKNSDYFVQCILNETAQAQIDDNDRVYIFTHLINLLSEFVLHQGIEIHSCPFVPMFKQLFDALIECGTTIPLWYLLKCFSNLLTSNSLETDLLLDEMIRLNLISSIVHYTATLIKKSNLGQGQMLLTELHQKVLISSLIILYNISTDDGDIVHILDRDLVLQQICRPLFHSNIEHLRLMSCLLYSNLLTEQEFQLDQSTHQLADELIAAIRQAFQSENYYYFNEIPLLSLVNCLKKLCTHREFQRRLGHVDENVDLLFQILRQFHASWDQQEEIEVILQSIWFLSFEYSSASKIHRHDKYFALLVQLAETNPNERIQQAAKGILWQLRQTISTPPSTPEPQLPNSSQHIMFSYNHDSKELVHRICQALQQAGYRTWIDVDDMHGSTLECMAHAVEQSKAILICMSEKYKRSPNCQSEAEYAHRLGKPFIPVLLQAKYKPDGWLGMLLGTRLYIDFTKNDFQWNIRKLVKEIEVIQH